ncbi:MAG: adenylosuccinate lyase [Fidelibacterota bacterium]
MLKAISPLDGRYSKRVEKLGDYFSEYALMGARIWVELQYLTVLDKTMIFPPLNKREIRRIEKLSGSFGKEDYDKIKEIEAELNHDVKACEIYLTEVLKLRYPNMIHFGLTSEDVNNISHTLLMKKYRDELQLPQLKRLLLLFAGKIKEWKSLPFPARTHGQMASPSTAGKELAVFASRLLHQYKALKSLRFRGKCNGATGNYSAMLAAAPGIDWIKLSKDFLKELGLDMNPVTTQIEDHDTWAEYFSISARINNIILDMNTDMWSYLMLGYITQIPAGGEVGSSTMPHKVNPINFENSEGNIGISNALLKHIGEKLMLSRLQRDLSDSTVERNFGVALGHAYLAAEESMRGLEKITVNSGYCEKELNAYPELLAEPIQTILRRENFEKPYEMLKNLTRTRKLSIAELNKFINALKVSDEVRKELAELRAYKYTGLAEKICEEVLRAINKI